MIIITIRFLRFTEGGLEKPSRRKISIQEIRRHTQVTLQERTYHAFRTYLPQFNPLKFTYHYPVANLFCCLVDKYISWPG